MRIAERKTTVELTVKEWYAVYSNLAQAGGKSAEKIFNVAVFKNMKNVKQALAPWEEKRNYMSEELKIAIDLAGEADTTIAELITAGDDELSKLVEDHQETMKALDEEMSTELVSVDVYKFSAEEASDGISGLFLMMLDENGMLLD